jgi:hypothetical protein
MKRFGVNYGRLYPPPGDVKNWWRTLKQTLGTTSSSFVSASLEQLQAAARLPDGMVSETGMNAALALIQAIAPTNEIEAALAIQMACTHAAAMASLGRIGSVGPQTIAACSSAAATLMRAYAHQLETLRRLRGGGAQLFQVGHVHINEGAQAVIGTVALTETRKPK